MPDGARNGLTTEINSDADFLYDEKEDDEEDNQRLKKSFNLNFIFDLFRAAMDGKVGDKYGNNSSPRHSSKGPRDSDYVMLVLNQKQKENEEVALLLDRLRQNGVTCIFFTRNDLRNGTIKPSSGDVSDVLNGKSNSMPQSLPLPLGLPHGHSHCNVSPMSEHSDNTELVKPSSLPISITLSPPLALSLGQSRNNGIVKSTLNNISIPETHEFEVSSSTLDLPVLGKRKRTSSKGTKKSTKKPNVAKELSPDQCLVTLPLLPLPSVEVVTSNGNDDVHSINDITLTIKLTDEASPPKPTTTLSKPPPTKKKRKRRKKYPYGARKPVKKKSTWQAILKNVYKSELLTSSPSKPSKSQSSTYAAEFSDDDEADLVPNDPYVFHLDEFEEPVIERPYTPKKQFVTGVSKISSFAAAVSTFNDKAATGGKDREEPKSGESKVVINFDLCSPEITSGEAVKKPVGRRRGRKPKKRTGLKTKVQTKRCVQPISTGETLLQERDINDVVAGRNSTAIATATTTPSVVSLSQSEPEIRKEEPCKTPDIALEDIPSPLICLSAEITQEVFLKSKSEESTNSAQETVLYDQGPDVSSEPQTDLLLCAKVEREESINSESAVSEGSFMDAMQLRRPSFYSQIAGNVRNNLENHLDGRLTTDVKASKRRKRNRNGFLLHHGDNFPEDPEAPYKLHLATQIILKLNKRRSKFKPKEDKGRSLLSYLKLVPKRSSRAGRGSFATANNPPQEDLPVLPEHPLPVFSGEWTQERKFVCNICGHVEDYFWNMVHHKGEIHPGVVVTHVELPDDPPIGFRFPPNEPSTSLLPPPPPCSKCSASFTNYPDLHRHIFECAGNAAWLEEVKPPRKKRGKRKRGFKRRLSNTPRKAKLDIPKRRFTEVFKCEFCTREFKTEGWLKNHLVTHSLPISIPLSKLTLPSRASFTTSRRSHIQNIITKT